MKEIKYLLNALFWGGYASAWWAAALFGCSKETIGLWVIAVLLSLFLAGRAGFYLIDHWNDQ